MFNFFKSLLVLLFVGVIFTGCSSTEMLGSWISPDHHDKVENVYIIGVAKDATNRRIFEDAFSRKLISDGVKAVSSYKNLPSSLDNSKEVIIAEMTKNGCDSVLLTKLTGQREETVVNPGYVSGYSSGPYYGGRGGYGRPAYYDNWNSFYRRSDFTYQPATTTQFTVLSVESVMYDLKTEKLIWSAKLETYVEGNFNKMMQDYVNVVTEDLKSKGLI